MKAYLSLTSSHINKNSTTKTELINAGYNTVEPATYFTEIGSFEKNVNLSDFSVTYYASDTEQKHPIYYRHIANNEKIPIAENLGCLYIEPESNLHINLNKITEGEVFNTGWGTVDGINNNTSMQYFFSMPFTPQINPALTAPDFFGVGTRQRYTRLEYTGIPGNAQSVEPLSVVSSKYFEGSALSGIKCYYDDNNNKVLAPYPDEDGYIYGLNVAGEKEMRLGSAIEVYSTLENRATVYYCKYDFCYLSFLKEDGVYYTENFWPCLYHFQNDKLYVRGGYDDICSGKTPVAFLRDKDGQYWCYQLSRIEQYEATTGQTQAVINRDRFVLTVVKVEDLPKFINGRVDNAVDTVNVSTWLSDEFEDVSLIYKRLDRVFQPQKDPSYDDGGPDIVGPGDDPYDGVLDNSDEVVGGQPNMEDIIETDDGGYNNGGSLIRAWSSYYGSYVLDQSSLSKYVNTLTWLNEQWDKPLMWPIYSIMSDRLKNNTINLIHLPYTISSENYTPGKFVIGNTPIMASTTDNGLIGDWKWGRDAGIATANKLTQEITTDTVNLGVLSHHYDNFLDFAPYSSASLYIPYIGTVDIPINLIQSTSSEQKNLQLLFRINNATGDMVVLLQVNGSTLKQWTGNCARDVQISVDATGGVLRSMTKEIVGGVVGMASGFTSIPTASNSSFTSRTAYEAAKEQYNMMSPAMQKANPQIGKDIKEYEASHSASGDVTMTTLAENSMPNSTPVPNHSIGNMPVSGEVGFMGPQEVRLIVERPIIWRPHDYGDLIGYPTKKIAKLSSVQGFATVSNIHLRCSATLAEKSEIEKLLSAGVIF